MADTGEKGDSVSKGGLIMATGQIKTNKTTYIIDGDTVEPIDEGARAEIASLKEDINENVNDVNDLKSAFNDLDYVTTSLNKFGLKYGHITVSNGTEDLDQHNQVISDYIPVTSDTNYYIITPRDPNDSVFILFYTEKDGNSFIKYIPNTSYIKQFTTPSGANYIRCASAVFSSTYPKPLLSEINISVMPFGSNYDSEERRFVGNVAISSKHEYRIVTPYLVNSDVSGNFTKAGISSADLLHIKSGSYFFYDDYATDQATAILRLYKKNDNGTYTQIKQAGGFMAIDQDINNCKIYILFSDNRKINPSYIKEHFHFELILEDYKDHDLEITFIGSNGEDGVITTQDIVQGDCTLIKFPNNKFMMIDSHWDENHVGVASALHKRGVYHIDYIIVSHYHRDHVNGFQVLSYNDEINIDETTVVYCPEFLSENQYNQFDDGSTTYIFQTQFQNHIADKNCTVIHPTNSDDFAIGDAKVIWCNYNQNDYLNSESEYYSTNYNDLSLCNYVIYGNMTIFFSGDIGIIAQQKLGGTLLKTNILKTEHHGWDGGANNLIPKYINNICPDVLITMNGKANLHNSANPNSSIDNPASPMQSYSERFGVPNYCTIFNGNIHFIVSKDSWSCPHPISKYIRPDSKNWKYVNNVAEYGTN